MLESKFIRKEIAGCIFRRHVCYVVEGDRGEYGFRLEGINVKLEEGKPRK